MTSDQPVDIDFTALLDEIQSHPGTIARRAWDALTDVHAAMDTNQRELILCLRSIEHNENNVGVTMSGNVGPADDRRAMFREVLRLLLNYVGSAVTLVDHTRNLMRTYEETPTHADYELRRMDAIGNSVVPFVTKLRNYMMHVGIPSFGVQTAVTNDPSTGNQTVTITVYLDRDDALGWKGWPTAAREYLDSKPSKISMLEVIEEYASVIEGLYRWLYDQFPTLHGADIDAVNELGRPLREHIGRGP